MRSLSRLLACLKTYSGAYAETMAFYLRVDFWFPAILNCFYQVNLTFLVFSKFPFRVTGNSAHGLSAQLLSSITSLKFNDNHSSRLAKTLLSSSFSFQNFGNSHRNLQCPAQCLDMYMQYARTSSRSRACCSLGPKWKEKLELSHRNIFW